MNAHDHFLPHNARVVERTGAHIFFHLHSTGCRHWRDVLSIPGLAGLQLTIEANGPDLADLLSILRDILERLLLILFVDHGFAQLSEVLPRLPWEGLYLIVRSDRIPSDDDFHRFVARHWKRR